MAHRSVSARFEPNIIKDYKHWTLLIDEDQRYLGRAYAWLARPGEMQRLSSLTRDERDELHDVVMKEYERALEYLWKPEHLNYAWLGNYISAHGGHGHMHFIPRYRKQRQYITTFEDGRFKPGDEKNYVPYEPMKVTNTVLVHIRDAIRSNL